MEILSIFSDTLFHMSAGLVGILIGAYFVNRRKAKKQKEADQAATMRQNKEPKPGSAAHYEAWRAEQKKKDGKE